MNNAPVECRPAVSRFVVERLFAPDLERQVRALLILLEAKVAPSDQAATPEEDTRDAADPQPADHGGRPSLPAA